MALLTDSTYRMRRNHCCLSVHFAQTRFQYLGFLYRRTDRLVLALETLQTPSWLALLHNDRPTSLLRARNLLSLVFSTLIDSSCMEVSLQ